MTQNIWHQNHDELLNKLHDFEMNECYENECANNYRALRAVVELHKPYESKPWKPNSVLRCKHCTDYATISYPCQTIQAIEKELDNGSK